MARKYVIVVMEHEGNPHDHVFVKQCASIVVPTLEEALHFLDIFSSGRKLIVYLSGPITGCTFRECTDWRKGLGGELELRGHVVLDPMRGKDFLSHVHKMSAQGEPHHLMATPHAIVARDSNDCASCDVMVVNLLGAESISIGTMMEIAWGYGS